MQFNSHLRALRKIPYLFSSLFLLLKFVGNKSFIVNIFAGASTELKTKFGTITISTPLDALILKETVIDDCYHLSFLTDPHVIVDIGAAYGDFSWYAKKLYPSAKVIAYEPDKFHIPLLEKNIKPLGCVIRHEAIGSQGEIEMMIHSAHTQSSAHLVKGVRPISTYKVASITLDRALNEYDVIDLVKIDCEGAEKEIFDQADPVVFSKIKCFSIEYHEFVVPGVLEHISNHLKKYGYTIEIKQNPFTNDFGFIYAKK
ncbi:MAG: FkbM family methyltransferase [Candidatus Roizmanbacteria bacterium]